jgi:hypothetical protein
MHADGGFPLSPELTDGDTHARQLNRLVVVVVVVVPFAGRTPQWVRDRPCKVSAAVGGREWAPCSKSKRRRRAGTAAISARRLTGNGCAVQSAACQTRWGGQSWAELTRAVWTKREQR